MKNKKEWFLLAVLLVFATIIRLFSSNAARVEQYYSNGIYPYISVFLRKLLGWLPFSLGDVLYGLIGGWLLIWVIQVVRAMLSKKLFVNGLVPPILRITIKFLSIYILFNALWGINYNRKGIASQLGLSIEKYSVADLKALNKLLLEKVNASNNQLMQQPTHEMSSKDIFGRSQEAYTVLNKKYPFLNYRPPSIKASMWGWLGNYVGFLGYYNPFTGEGQVNTTVPKFLQSFTSCHEIAHQLGYAKENEANFVGYLAAADSKEVSLHYSVYLDLFLYANRNLFATDSAAANQFLRELPVGVKSDLKEWRKFNARHKNPVEPVIRWMYGKYLENNEQPSGMLSYDEVTGFLVAYNKKYGKL